MNSTVPESQNIAASLKQQNKLWQRILRRLCGLLPKSLLSLGLSWCWLRYYPALIPSDMLLKKWNDSHWEEYQRWLQQHTLQNSQAWLKLNKQAAVWRRPPKISIVTPVHNTDPEILYECILSVRTQVYPYWQLLLVDDASVNDDTRKLLASGVCKDPRIKVYGSNAALGISGASNIGIEHATGDYVLFLDHDDRLALDALYEIAREIDTSPTVDIVYADRDMINAEGFRFLHLFKPDWSPETLLSGNYIFHPMCYQRQLLKRLGGLRSEYDGSQDFDLILRVAETNPRVRHVQKVLYHWRQHELSVAMHPQAKEYAFKAGLQALNAAVKRRGLNATVREISGLWRGNYTLQFKKSAKRDMAVIVLEEECPAKNYAQVINKAMPSIAGKSVFAITSNAITPLTEGALEGLAAWLEIDGLGLVSGKVLDPQGNIDYCGMAYKPNGDLIKPYRGFSESEAGYMAVTGITRNISAPHPYCVLINTALWRELHGFDENLSGPHALLDFALRAIKAGWRCAVIPQYRFACHRATLLDEFTEIDRQQFKSAWQLWMQQGDPYYNSNLNKNSPDMGLEI